MLHSLGKFFVLVYDLTNVVALQERAKQAKKQRTAAKSGTKKLELQDEEGVGVLDNLLEALHSGSALQTNR